MDDNDAEAKRKSRDRKEWRTAEPAGEHQAYEVETVVVPDHGQWTVEIVVVFEDEVVRRRINTYRTQKLAQISADLIKRTATRELPGGPING